MQHPDLAADQLDEAVKKLGLRGAAIGGSVEAWKSPIGSSIRSGQSGRARSPVVHASTERTGNNGEPASAGKGGLGNTIGNPLETTVFLSHLIF